MTTSDARLLDVEDVKVGELCEVGEHEVLSLCNLDLYSTVILDDSAVKWHIE